MRKLMSLVGFMLLMVLALFAYLNRDRLTTAWGAARGDAESRIQASPQLAEVATQKLQSLESTQVEAVALSEAEVQSLLQYKYRQLLPAFVDSPSVQLENDRIQVKARVPVDRLPQIAELGEAAAFLPDTTEVGITGQLLPMRDGRVALTVDQVKVARIPLPRRLVASALARLGRKDESGLPRDALAIPLPSGVAAAYVRGDSLILLSNGRPARQ